jgi:peptidoglycan LD-endopeptidase LytH
LSRAPVGRPAVTWLIGAATGFVGGILVVRPEPPRTERETPAVAAAAVMAPTTIAADPLEDLRRRHLTLPVQGLRREELRDTFEEMRGGSRRHEALDIAAPRHTPVLAVEDGRVAKLFLSQAGGTTVYQFDPTSTYAYYYAHLERYADGLQEGDALERGQVIGYVGTSGNAPPNAPHLHFSIFKLTDAKRWWQGTAIDPFLIFK